MKKVLLLVLGLVVCHGVRATVISEDLKQGEKLAKSLELEFNDEAKEAEAYISWELVGDWDKFEYSFSQGMLEKNVFTLNAANYKEFINGENGVTLTIEGKPKTADAIYSLLMKVVDVSDDLDFPKEQLDLDLNVHFILPPPPPLWKRLLMPFIILVFLTLIILLVLSATAKFPKGLLQLGHDEVSLKGKSRISVREELEKMGVMMDGDTDVVFVKKRFGRFQGPCIKEMHNCSLERDGLFVSSGTVLLPDEELRGLTDINGNEIIIRYC